MVNRCNGIIDCVDGSDEDQCDSLSSTCPQGSLECSRSPGHCIPDWKICDGFLDCLDGDDERQCSRDKCLGQNQFYCQQDQTCIKAAERYVKKTPNTFFCFFILC